MLEMIRPQLHRPDPTPHRPANQKPPGKLGEKENKRVEEGEGIERLVLLKVRRMSSKPTPPKLTLARPEKPRKKPSRKPSKKPQRGDVGMVPAGGILPKSYVITTTRKAIMPSTALR